jgi:hypothetical protein
MDLLGNLANLKVDTVLSAVDKYVPGEFQLLESRHLAERVPANCIHNPHATQSKVFNAYPSIKHCSA